MRNRSNTTARNVKLKVRLPKALRHLRGGKRKRGAHTVTFKLRPIRKGKVRQVRLRTRVRPGTHAVKVVVSARATATFASSPSTARGSNRTFVAKPRATRSPSKLAARTSAMSTVRAPDLAGRAAGVRGGLRALPAHPRHRAVRRVAALIAAAGALLAAASAQPPRPPPAGGARRGTAILQVRDGGARARLRSTLAARGLRAQALKVLPMVIVRGSAADLRAAAASPDVVAAHPDRRLAFELWQGTPWCSAAARPSWRRWATTAAA